MAEGRRGSDVGLSIRRGACKTQARGAGSPRHSCKAEPSSATSEASTRHLLSDKSPQGSSSPRAGGGGGGCGGGAACVFLRAGLLGASGASVGLGAVPRAGLHPQPGPALPGCVALGRGLIWQLPGFSYAENIPDT